MKHPHGIFLWLLPFALFGQPVSLDPAENQGPFSQEAPLPETRTVHFSVFVWPEGGVTHAGTSFSGIPRVFYDAPDGKMAPVPLYLNRSSPMFAYTGPQPLKLYDVEREWIPPPEDAPPGTPPSVRKPGRPFDFTPGDYTQESYPRIFIYGIDPSQRLRLLHTNRINFRDQSTNFFIVIPEGVRRVRIKSLGSFQE